MDLADELPVCATCQHRHELGTKCAICGHIGKSNIYVKMRTKAAGKRACHYDTIEGEDIRVNTGLWDIICEIRNQVYVNEWGIPPAEESVEHIESSARHFIFFMGDAPIAAARYRPVVHADGSRLIFFDKLAVLPEYRRRGIGKHCTSVVISDIQQVTRISSVHIPVPASSWIQAKLEASGMAVDARFAPINVNGQTFVTIICEVPATATIAAACSP